jgi:hypothetical protein
MFQLDEADYVYLYTSAVYASLFCTMSTRFKATKENSKNVSALFPTPKTIQTWFATLVSSYFIIVLFRYLYCFVGQKKLDTVICPDPWKDGARNTVE